ncbi:LAGLIDADG family homing endonuclease [Bacillus sp. ISL-35]|uniref:LAGLIDADG family homing endonuclease n=1 Tax=Bacillus sp. ISL-35 TaxID=2819122 RepID=UPI001BE96F75|nr:LAGLIDADG family homing endonuclease [Bacillus sp. ISL-35]MBT2703954.1 LAGLIDADG family homing endonuclease [Chryseobacterium sp. ISL-80]
MEVWEASYIAGIIDGEGSITLTRMHEKEHRRPTITIASTDKELLLYIQSLIGGVINNKKNYRPEVHKSSYTLSIKNKLEVLSTLQQIQPFLRINRKRLRALWILKHYESVTPRNGKYRPEMLKAKIEFEDLFFKI